LVALSEAVPGVSGAISGGGKSKLDGIQAEAQVNPGVVNKSANCPAYSADGVTWAEATLPNSRYWNAIAYGNGKFVAVAFNYDKAVYSANGTSWYRSTLPGDTLWNSIIYGGDAE
jgi:hypothetical protein